jgi:pyruvate formate lyase activating enzyme
MWCNNPESLESSPSIMFDERLCHQFGDCIRAANGKIIADNGKLVINRDLIADTSIFRKICPSKALIVTGDDLTIAQIIQEIEKDMPFYRMSEGGVTLAGGEPLSQGPELKELMVALKKRGIHISVETSLHLAWEVIESYIDLTDVFLADLKHTDPDKFAKFTGGDASLVMNNFKKLDKTGKKFIVRVPVIPEFNFSSTELFAIIDFASGLKHSFEIDFIPYHELAKEKYTMLGKEYKFGSHTKIEKSQLSPFTEYAEQKGRIVRILN